MRSIANALIAATVVAAFTCAEVALTATPVEAQGKSKSIQSGNSGAGNAGTTRSSNKSGSRVRSGSTKGLSGTDLGSGR